MPAAIDYDTDPRFNPPEEDLRIYLDAIGRLDASFKKEGVDHDALLAEAQAYLRDYTPKGLKERFGVGSPYTLAKEYYYDTICANAGAVARILEQRGGAEQAKAFLADLYGEAAAEGFSRDKEFLPNRLDSRTFMPMRRHIDRAYLEAIGYRHLDKILLCVGDCQTTILSEQVRQHLPLPGIDMAGYHHVLGSLLNSPLRDLFRPVGYFYFVNAAANYGLHAAEPGQREKVLESMREIVRYLQEVRPEVSVFVTHVFFGVDNAVRYGNAPREGCLDAVGPFSDEVAAILAEAPNAHLINFQEICPFTPGMEAFRDKPDSPAVLHFRFRFMEAVLERVLAALAPLSERSR